MAPETDNVTDLLTQGVAVFTEHDVTDELPEAFTEPLVDGEDVTDGNS